MPPASSGSTPSSASWFGVHAALFASNVLLGSMGPVLKGIYPSLSPLAVAPLRIGGVGLAALFIARMGGIVLPPRSAWPALFGLSLLGIALNQLMFLIGLSMTSAITGMILITTIPIFTYAVAVAWKQERYDAWRMAGVAVACAGALTLVFSRGGGLEGVSVLGSGLIVLNCFCYSWYLVLSRPYVTTHSAQGVMVLVFAFGGAVIVPLCAPFLLKVSWSAVPAMTWAGVAYVLFGPTLVAYFLNAWALQRGASASFVALYIYLQPLVAAAIAIPLLGEQVTWVMAASALLILTGILLVTRREAEQPVLP